MEAIWPDAAVTDDSLVQCLVEIRRALGDDQAWVHTARGRGYRFDAAVRPIVDSARTASGSRDADSRTFRPRAARPMPVDAVPAWSTVAGGRASSIGGAPSPLVAWEAGGWRRASLAADRQARAPTRRASGAASGSSRESIGQAIAAYERAIALDPTFAPAHAALANTLVVRGVFGGARPDDSYPRAREAALRAVELDPMLAEGHVALGHVRVQWDRDWRGAEEQLSARAGARPEGSARPHALRAVPQRDDPRRREPARSPTAADRSGPNRRRSVPSGPSC